MIIWVKISLPNTISVSKAGLLLKSTPACHSSGKKSSLVWISNSRLLFFPRKVQGAETFLHLRPLLLFLCMDLRLSTVLFSVIVQPGKHVSTLSSVRRWGTSVQVNQLPAQLTHLAGTRSSKLSYGLNHMIPLPPEILIMLSFLSSTITSVNSHLASCETSVHWDL